MTVSFGLGLSATVHFLNRVTQERKRSEDPAIAVERATVLVGPALILTTFVLACGLAALVLSDLPALRQFGWLSAFAMLAALVADLLILRPVAAFLLRLGWPGTPIKMATVGRFLGEIIAPASTAAVSLISDDRRQAVSIPVERRRDFRRPH